MCHPLSIFFLFSPLLFSSPSTRVNVLSAQTCDAKVHIPPPKLNRGNGDEGLVPITDLEPWAQLAFKGTKRLNPMQSKVRRGGGGLPARRLRVFPPRSFFLLLFNRSLSCDPH